jgi:hypothetical protein
MVIGQNVLRQQHAGAFACGVERIAAVRVRFILPDGGLSR